MGQSEPRVIGRYALHDEIASGGMATIYLGHLIGSAGFTRVVAIKRLHRQFARDPEFVAMFLDEARLAARIRHPNVVPTLDVVATDGELFLVMEYVQGESLAAIMRRLRGGSSVPVDVAAAIVVGVLHGLHAAHETKDEAGHPLDIVHRDISPQNVLVGSDGVPRVVDFGVAKAANRLQSTSEGQVKGKFGYMPPEQVMGDRVTRAADIYSAGVVLWETLAGRRLFSGANQAETIAMVIANDVPPLGSVVADVPPALEEVVACACDRDPGRRFATAREMARAIERALHVAQPTDVAEWVERIVGKDLAARAALVQATETWSPPGARESLATMLADRKRDDRASRRPAAPAPPGDASTVTRLATSSAVTPATPARRRAVLATAVTAGIFTIAVAGAFVFGARRAAQERRPSEATHDDVAAASTSAAAAAPPAPRDATPTATAAATAAAAVSASAAAATPRATAVAPETSPPPPRAATTTTPRRTARPRPGCTPPYTVDAAGSTHFKVECL